MASGQALVPVADRGISDAGVTFIGVIVAICLLSGLSVLLRIWGRMREFGTCKSDDYTIILAWLFCLTTVILTCYWIPSSGVGYSIATIPPDTLVHFFKIFYALQILYVMDVFIVKVSILLLYIRIFDTPKFKIIAWTTMGLCCAWWLASVTSAVVQCLPIHAAWDLAIQPQANCMDKQKLYWGVGISNLLLDVMILALPMPVIWTLNLNKQRKLAITVIFLTGSVVCLSSILRVTSIGQIENSDFTKTVDAASLWSSVEANVAVIAACLPTLGHVFMRFKKQVSSHMSRSHGDPERSGLTYESHQPSKMDNTQRSQRTKKAFDPYSTDVVGAEKYEMGNKMSGWKSGTNEAYVEIEDSPTTISDSDSRDVGITTEVKSVETFGGGRR